MELVDYLRLKYGQSTVKRYGWEIDRFLQSTPTPEKASYPELLAYIAKLRQQGAHNKLDIALAAITAYYQWLNEIGKRSDNPARAIKIRDRARKPIQLQDLFTTQELELLLKRKERWAILKNRNRLIMSLLIHQGLTNGEICRLELNDLDLERGTINIGASKQNNGRILQLKANQAIWLVNYLNNDRKRLLRNDTPRLILTRKGNPESGEGIAYLLETCRHLFPNRRLTTVTIRQSVIANLLKSGKDIRLAQAFAGHKKASSTEKYLNNDVEQLKNQLMKFHPLGGEEMQPVYRMDME